ncbi:hypothetical protein CONPUDRAFT_155102 [Coniophora puteana RWD-64-598 SS2]|uniref:Uncharacterized protein n=1 Tax=Coniophora puteana (strain RWD-64-598) TaxID=741705 RepID=A0A5M3ML10_CONPW|nr:uncharacterized protein CONPUDRAFT_155102 [Coniophora puteana RWD-64-598 SS2]EIW79707.1 hypothetical protein CONPUDRAFT_155102 [Coniophora puteana RWD-64-598 SS2]
MTQPLVEFTVHNFSNASEASLSLPSSSALRDEARKLVECVQDTDGWRSVFIASQDESPRFALRNAYQYVYDPPAIKYDSQRLGIENLKSWGEPPDADELVPMEDLEPFHSTDLRDPEPPEASQPQIHARPTLELEDTSVLEERPLKRPRLDIEPLYDLIPQPHYHSIPSGKYDPFNPERCPPFPKRPAVPVPPQTQEAVVAVLEQPYARVAWVIPVRGDVPYEGATEARLLLAPGAPASHPSLPTDHGAEDEYDSVLPSAPDTDLGRDARITWTRAAVLDFWTFLLRMQQAKYTGPTAVSFHPASPDPMRSLSLPPSASAFRSQSRWDDTSATISQVPSTEESESRAHDLTEAWRKTRLQSADYVKVFHDAAYTRYLRNILDAYWFGAGHEGEPKPDDAMDVDRPGPKIKPLRGARLALLDDRGRGLLVW